MNTAIAQNETVTPVLEIVSFRLNQGVDPADFLKAARRIETLLRDHGKASRRFLVVDAQGLWTDVIEWANMDVALKAAEELVKDPIFAPVEAMIDAASVTMRHAPIQSKWSPLETH